MSCLSHHHHHHQLHVHSYTITPCSISNITPQQTCTRWATSQLSIPYYRSSSSLSLRSDKPVAAIVSIFPFPLHQQKKTLRSTFTSLINLLPFYMFNLFVHTCIKLYCYAIPSYPFSFHMLFFSKFKVARTLFFK